jgi:hypothetical protein
MMLKPLQLKGASLERNHAETTIHQWESKIECLLR